jgi:YD repeat-containing protein
MKTPSLRHDIPINEFEVNLDSGLFVLRQTDLFVPDVMPLSLTRPYRPWDLRSQAFGTGGNHPYDICPTGTRNPYTYMDLNLEDGCAIHLRRISKGTGYADAVFRYVDSSSDFYGSQVAWNGNGWTLDFKDHRRFLFPESYYAKNCAQGAPVEIEDGEGHSIQLKRNALRNLEELISPTGNSIKFKYDSSDRIVEARDSMGNLRKYSYDPSGHLETVSDESQVLYRFEYARLLSQSGFDPYLLTAVMNGDWQVLLRNDYRYGRVSVETLGDGRIYKYQYMLDARARVTRTKVTLPGGEVREFNFQNGILVK